MPTLKLTQAAVERLKPPASGRIEVWDSQLPGFGLRISETGSEDVAGFLPRRAPYGAREARHAGADPERRRRARAGPAEHDEGAHRGESCRGPAPQEEEERRQAEAEEARKKNTLAAVIDRYLAERPADRSRKPMRAEYLAETARTLDKNVKQSALGKRPLDEITGDDIKRLVRGIAKDAPSQANHTLAYLKAMLGWAVDEGLIEKNPAAGVKMPAQKVERERALGDEEIRPFWLACDEIGWPFGPLAQLLLLTAQRRDELAHATGASSISTSRPGRCRASGPKTAAAISCTSRRSLSRSSRNCRASPARRAGSSLPVWRRRQPVSGFGRGRERIAAAMAAASGEEVAPFTLHDLRRSAATGMAALGIAPHVVDKILNHSSGKIAGVAKIYNRFRVPPRAQGCARGVGPARREPDPADAV